MGNLSFDVTRDELIQAFSAAGKVVDAKVPTDRETGRPRGFAFVEFESDEAAEKSITMLNGKDLKGRPLRVNEAENRPPRAPGMGAPSFRPGGYRPPGAGYSAPSFNEFTPMDDRGGPSRTRAAAATSAAVSAGSTSIPPPPIPSTPFARSSTRRGVRPHRRSSTNGPTCGGSSFAELGVEEIIVSPGPVPFAMPDPSMLELFSESVIRHATG